ncbi:hypothetical protein D3C86_1990990 [compost metagenome]
MPISPKVPACRPPDVAPMDSQLSSRMVMSRSPTIREISEKSLGLPSRLTRQIARVRSVTAASNFFRSMLRVSGSISTKTSFRPYCWKGK